MTAAREERCPDCGTGKLLKLEGGRVHCLNIECAYDAPPPSPAPESCPECDGTKTVGFEPMVCPSCDGSGRVSKTSGGEARATAPTGDSIASAYPHSSPPVDPSSPVVDREREAFIYAYGNQEDVIHGFDRPGFSPVVGRDGQLVSPHEAGLAAVRPLIVEAEHARLREAIEGLREPEEGFGKKQVRQAFNVGLDSALAVIDEKGDTDG